MYHPGCCIHGNRVAGTNGGERNNYQKQWNNTSHNTSSHIKQDTRTILTQPSMSNQRSMHGSHNGRSKRKPKNQTSNHQTMIREVPMTLTTTLMTTITITIPTPIYYANLSLTNKLALLTVTITITATAVVAVAVVVVVVVVAAAVAPPVITTGTATMIVTMTNVRKHLMTTMTSIVHDHDDLREKRHLLQQHNHLNKMAQPPTTTPTLTTHLTTVPSHRAMLLANELHDDNNSSTTFIPYGIN